MRTFARVPNSVCERKHCQPFGGGGGGGCGRWREWSWGEGGLICVLKKKPIQKTQYKTSPSTRNHPRVEEGEHEMLGCVITEERKGQIQTKRSPGGEERALVVVKTPERKQGKLRDLLVTPFWTEGKKTGPRQL